MEPPPGRNASFADASSIHARLSPAVLATSDLVLEAQFKARMEEIEWQRDEESASMSNRLYALVTEYKKRDQSFVDRYTECLEQASRLPSLAGTRPWAKPCRGIVEQEIFCKAGVIIRFYPDTGRLPFPPGDDTDEGTNTPRQLSPVTATDNLRNSPRAPSFSPLSSIHSSPKDAPKPTCRPSETRPRKRTKRPASPDELALNPTSPPFLASTEQKINGVISRTPQQASSRTPLPSRKPLPTHSGRHQTVQPSSTPTLPTPAQRPPTPEITTINATTTQTPLVAASSSPLSSPSRSPSSTPPAPQPPAEPTPVPVTLKSNPDSDSNSRPNTKTGTNPAPKPTSNPKKAKKTKAAANRRGPLPPPPPLRCLECRRRKVRCSRARPKCAQCSRIGRDCAYPDDVRVGSSVGG